MFQLINLYYNDNPEPSYCENCGHDIRICYVLQHTELGKQLIVGSECFEHLCAPNDLPNGKKLQKRIERAKRQYLKNEPPKKPNESRGEYINRRLTEMQNAIKAKSAFSTLLAKNSFYQIACNRITNEMSDPRTFWGIISHENTDEQVNITYGHTGKRGDCETCQRIKLILETWEKLAEETAETILKEFETQHNCNRFDVYKPIWELRKL